VADAGGPYPLSAAEEAIWLEEVKYPGRVSSGFFTVSISGEVAPGAIEAACRAVCADHPDLRMTLVDREGPRLLVHPVEEVFRFDREPVAAAEGTELAVARRWYAEHRDPTWDLALLAPIRFIQLEHDARRRTLVVSVHHIAFDGRSKFVFASQFCAALAQILAGGTVTPAGDRPPVRPAESDRIEDAVRYWREADLPNLPPLLLPHANVGYGSAAIAAGTSFDLPATFVRWLRDAAGTARVSVFAGILAGATAHLAGYGNDRVVFGVPADISTERTRAQIGLQVNVVPCIVEVPRGASFRDVLRRAAVAAEHVRRQRAVPFTWLVRQLHREHGVDVGGGVFNRIAISHVRRDGPVGEVPGLSLEWDFFAPNSTQSFELTLQTRVVGERVFGRLDYDRSVFDEDTAGEFVAEFVDTLSRLAGNPDRPVRPVRTPPAATRVSRAPGDLSGDVAVAPVDGGYTRLLELADRLRDAPSAEPVEVSCPVEQFLPTAGMAALAGAGVRILLTLADPKVGPIASAFWPGGAGPVVLDRLSTMEELVVLDAHGERLPPRVAGTLAVAPCGGGPLRGTEFRVAFDRRHRLCFLGTTSQVSWWAGRSLDAARLERQLAGLPGVRELAICFAPGEQSPRPLVLLAPVVAPEPGDDRRWRRAVSRSWPPTIPTPARVMLAPRIPRLRDGRTDYRAVAAGEPFPTRGRSDSGG
jgi:hypothetical protein